MERINRGVNVLVTGRPGVGKSAVMHSAWRQARGDRLALWIPGGTTKSMLIECCRQVYGYHGLELGMDRLPRRLRVIGAGGGSISWDALAPCIRRIPTRELIALVVTAVCKTQYLVFFDKLEMPPSQAEFFHEVLEHAQVVAGKSDDNRRSRIQRVLWRFPEELPVKPLQISSCEAIIERRLEGNPLRFHSERTKGRFVRHVARVSGGVPLAIICMMDQAEALDEITPANAASVYHNAGVNFFDLSPLLFIVVAVFIAMRFISRGMNDIEMLVLSGVASVLFMSLRFLLNRMR
jgi:hypothetical protein